MLGTSISALAGVPSQRVKGRPWVRDMAAVKRHPGALERTPHGIFVQALTWERGFGLPCPCLQQLTRQPLRLLEQSADMATALLAGEKLRELILPGSQDDKAGALAALLLQLKLELPFDRVVTIGTVLVPILLVTLVFTKNFAGEAGRASAGV